MGSSKGNTKGNNRVYNQIETLIRIKKVLQENGIDTSTQTEIGKYFGVVPSAISNWANDNKPIGLEKLIKVSSDFNVSLDWLVFGIEQSEEAPAETKKEPDSVEPVQTEKDIEDYTIEDICKGIAALTCIPRTTTQIIMNYDWLSSPHIRDMDEFLLPQFNIQVTLLPLWIPIISPKENPKNIIDIIDRLYNCYKAPLDLAYFLQHLRPMAQSLPIYKKELLNKIKSLNGISTETEQKIISKAKERYKKEIESFLNEPDIDSDDTENN